MRERQKKKKGRTWAEAAKTVLEKYPNTPMSHKEILQVIQRERLKEIRSGTSPLACLNAMLHTNSRGEEGIFYKVPGRMGVYTLKKDIGDVVKELSEEGSEEVDSDNLSDSQSTENNNYTNNQEGMRGQWRRRVPSTLPSDPSSPQPRCSSPSVPSSKLISPSQKHSKKALKQALKQQRNQRRQGGMPTTSSPRLLIKNVKDMADTIATKTDSCPASGTRKMSQRSSRLSARQLKRTKCAEIDVETPDSILVNTNLRALINKHTFSVLPTECQQKLLTLLPEVDQQACMDGLLKVTSSALNNEFFTSAAQSWKERLAEGEFTPELQLRMRQEIEKEKKVEYWKESFFESYYGENSGLSLEESKELLESGLSLELSATKPQLSPPTQPSPAGQALQDPKVPENSCHTRSSERRLRSSSLPINPTSKPIEPPSKPIEPPSKPIELSKPRPEPEPVHDEPVPVPPIVPPVILPKIVQKTLEVEYPRHRTRSRGLSLPIMAVEAPVVRRQDVVDSTLMVTPLGEKQMEEEEQKLKEAQPETPQSPEIPQSPALESPPEVYSQTKLRSSLPSDLSKPEPLGLDEHSGERREDVTPERGASVSVTPVSTPVSTPLSTPLSTPVSTPLSTPLSTPVSTPISTTPSPEPLKRKSSSSEQEVELTPEKRARITPPTVSVVTSPAATITTAQRVPPLKIPVSRILSVPASPTQVSPRTPVPLSPGPSPGRTGARTLADIKAKAQLARAQRAAAAAAASSSSKGAVPGPGPGGGIVEHRASAQTLHSRPPCSTQSQSTTRLPVSSITGQSTCQSPDAVTTPAHSSSVQSSGSSVPFDLSLSQRSSNTGRASLTDDQQRGYSDGLMNPGSLMGPQHGNIQHTSYPPGPQSTSSYTSSVCGVKSQYVSGSSMAARASHFIPANNPLVTSLLQGKEVPLEQILPKPLAKADVQMSQAKPSHDDKGTIKSHSTAGTASGENKSQYLHAGGVEDYSRSEQQGSIGQSTSTIPGTRAGMLAELQHHQRETPNKDIQEQILQALMHRATHQHQNQPFGVSGGAQPAQFGACNLGHQECGDHPRFSAGFPGRKRMSRPAMSGHYLLNVSTYGRGSESSKRFHPLNTVNTSLTPLANLKREHIGGERLANEVEESVENKSHSHSNPAGVKMEEQGFSVTKMDEALGFQHCSRIMSESPSVGGCIPEQEDNSSAGTGRDSGTSARAKETKPFTQSQSQHRRHLELCNTKQGGHSQQYRLSVSPHVGTMDPTHPSTHQRPSAFQTQRPPIDNQESILGSCYGGTISMSVPHALNHNAAASGTASSASPSVSGSGGDSGSGTGSVMSFSVTVTTIPAGHPLDHSSQGEGSPEQGFMEGSGIEDVQSKCYCRLKAMIMCKGCGAFCHDDCIGPSNLCVSCLVVR
ncbi:putative Polycomb group protein ASXL2 isoform X3 [Oncorhynchus tshawytscha]|uniref:putative Polycomb group protein ASXL2 isoform X3 n=1 Tax=Oncorhynchus tshawytscha TaxID=74940 RepID=UPI000D0A46CB|nr:putative Polycomb group protein ASXL2 isoform X3 [Oncorhynchus tshawytscha]